MDHTTRNRQLARIHALARDLRLSKTAYRNTLAALTGKRSAGDMTADECRQVIDFLADQQRPTCRQQEELPPVSNEEAQRLIESWGYAQ